MAKRILVVDDEPDIVTVMKFTLEGRGFEVITAYDGKEGLDKARTFKPDIIILDVLMPKMYGNTLVAELESNNDTKNIPIIFLSCLVDRSITSTEQDMRGCVFFCQNHAAKRS